MNQGFLSKYFEGVAAKRLARVEIDPLISNQHELNGVRMLKAVLGECGEPVSFESTFLMVADENESLRDNGTVTWYDSRRNNPNRAAECRLYFTKNEVLATAEPGDLLILARKKDGRLILVVAPQNSTVELQIMWLFGIENQIEATFQPLDISEIDPGDAEFAARFILDEIGIELDEPETDFLDAILNSIDFSLPDTRTFSSLARATVKESVSPLDNPDKALLNWINHEERMFRRLERYLIQEQLETGFKNNLGEIDVDGFISFSLSVQNRRKSRVGYALEHHLEAIFKDHELNFDRQGKTENNKKPDFLFPGTLAYSDMDFDASRLRMLGVKSTCKDRWRQVLSEANRITHKHLLTLEPGISENQTSEMGRSRLQLVLPKALHQTYSDNQTGFLWSLSDFIDEIKSLP